MERTEKRFLAVMPGSLTAAGRWGVPLAHLAYRMGEGPHLFRANSPAAPRGGLMVIEEGGFHGEGDAEPFCGEVVRECAARKFGGVVCRFRGKPRTVLREVTNQLAALCRDRGLSLWVTEPYAACGAKVLLPSALSGGTLRGRLEEAVSRFGAGRLGLWLEKSAEDFTLPSPTGSGTPLSREELQRLREDKGGDVFFSPDLCAHYFTYMAGETGHFVLFDDAASLRQKLHTARDLGVGTFFFPYSELEDILGEVL